MKQELFEQKSLGRILTELRSGEGWKNIVPLRNTAVDGRSGGPGSSEEDDYLSLRVELQFLASCPSENVQDGSWRWGLVLRGQSYKFWSHLFPDGVWSLRSLKVSQSVMLPRVWLIYNCWKSTWTTWSSSSTSAAHQLCDLAGGIYLLSLSFLAWKTKSIIAISLSSWE